MQHPIVIIGAGQAGLQVAESLRQEHYTGPIALLGDELHGPYNRPPLSKKWLLERPAITTLAIRGLEAIARREIALQTGVSVLAIDRAQRQLQLADGKSLSYAGLALCTGARLRTLSVPGSDLDGVFGLKTIDDAQALSAALDECMTHSLPVVVIGGGFIGLEVAASARKRGLEVTVLEGLNRLMSRVVAPIVSDATARVHRAHGTQLFFDVKIVEIAGREGRVHAVRLADGREFRAGCVVVGVGVNPDDGLAAAAGLECERGIVIDECSRSSDRAIVAAGDCSARRLPDGTLRRLESVQNAVEQGKSAAAALLGRERPFTATPWFWSDQYDLKLQMVGLSHGYDSVVTRGDLERPAFSAYYYRGEKLIAVDSLSRIPDHMLARKLLDAGISPLPEQAADEKFTLQALLPS
jgi:3-phenylpropionate/trans-cinnamate dioxygenase ferredoxin reductase subunit